MKQIWQRDRAHKERSLVSLLRMKMIGGVIWQVGKSEQAINRKSKKNERNLGNGPSACIAAQLLVLANQVVVGSMCYSIARFLAGGRGYINSNDQKQGPMNSWRWTDDSAASLVRE